MARAEGLDAIPRVGLRRVELPAESVVERKIGPQFPTILCEEIKLGGADVHRGRRSLGIFVWETEEIVGYETAEPDVVGTASKEVKTATDIVGVQLMHALVADVGSELQRMLTLNSTIGVQSLINVSRLGEIAGRVVAKSKAPI